MQSSFNFHTRYFSRHFLLNSTSVVVIVREKLIFWYFQGFLKVFQGQFVSLLCVAMIYRFTACLLKTMRRKKKFFLLLDQPHCSQAALELTQILRTSWICVPTHIKGWWTLNDNSCKLISNSSTVIEKLLQNEGKLKSTFQTFYFSR